MSPLSAHGRILALIVDPANGRILMISGNPATRHLTRPDAGSLYEHVRRLV
jgi:hypothetical protein